MQFAFRHKLLLDHTLGFIGVLIIKCIKKIFSVTISRGHSTIRQPNTIVIAKILGLGSIVYSGALCGLLKVRFPSSKIIYITSKSNKDFVERFTTIDKALFLDDNTIFSLIKSGLRLFASLWYYRPELYFDLEVYSSFSAILATLSFARNRYGFFRKSAYFKRDLYTHMFFFNTLGHISKIYRQMSLCVGANGEMELKGLLKLTDEDKNECVKVIKALGLEGERIILININASSFCYERRWPIDSWVEYLTKCTNYFPDYSYILVGSAIEQPYVSATYQKLPHKTKQYVYNVAGSFSLGVFLSLVDRCTLMVTNDSGPLHIAVSLGIPTVSLWGPGAPDHYLPKEGMNEVIYGRPYCSPCLYHADIPPCEGNNVCMKMISVSSVLAATERILGKIIEEHHSRETNIQVIEGKLTSFIPVIFHYQKSTTVMSTL